MITPRGETLNSLITVAEQRNQNFNKISFELCE